MRQNNLRLAAALATLALLAACGKQEATADTQAEIAAQVDQKQAELAQLQSDLAAQQAVEASSTPPPVAATTTPKPAAKPVSTKPSNSLPAKPVATRSITVPSGTQLNLALTSPLSSKTSKEGETVRALVTNDVIVEGRTAISQGTTVAGSLVKVISGSESIGGTPTLVLAFDRLELPGGIDVPISGEFESKGKSDNTRDAVKIVGGAAAGALIANQVSKKDKNKIIGGILGAAAGAVAAKETGTEVKLDEGAALTLTLSAPVEITRS